MKTGYALFRLFVGMTAKIVCSIDFKLSAFFRRVKSRKGVEMNATVLFELAMLIAFPIGFYIIWKSHSAITHELERTALEYYCNLSDMLRGTIGLNVLGPIFGFINQFLMAVYDLLLEALEAFGEVAGEIVKWATIFVVTVMIFLTGGAALAGGAGSIFASSAAYYAGVAGVGGTAIGGAIAFGAYSIPFFAIGTFSYVAGVTTETVFNLWIDLFKSLLKSLEDGLGRINAMVYDPCGSPTVVKGYLDETANNLAAKVDACLTMGKNAGGIPRPCFHFEIIVMEGGPSRFANIDECVVSYWLANEYGWDSWNKANVRCTDCDWFNIGDQTPDDYCSVVQKTGKRIDSSQDLLDWDTRVCGDGKIDAGEICHASMLFTSEGTVKFVPRKEETFGGNATAPGAAVV